MMKEESVLRETFEMVKRKKGKSGQKIKNLIRKELHGIE